MQSERVWQSGMGSQLRTGVGAGGGAWGCQCHTELLLRFAGELAKGNPNLSGAVAPCAGLRTPKMADPGTHEGGGGAGDAVGGE